MNNMNRNFMSLTSNRSIGGNKITILRQHQSNQNFYSHNRNKRLKNNHESDLLSDSKGRQMNTQNLNQISASSFVLSDTRGETTAHYNNSKNNSQNGSMTKLANVTVQSVKDEETILSLNVQPSNFQAACRAT